MRAERRTATTLSDMSGEVPATVLNHRAGGFRIRCGCVRAEFVRVNSRDSDGKRTRSMLHMECRHHTPDIFARNVARCRRRAALSRHTVSVCRPRVAPRSAHGRH